MKFLNRPIARFLTVVAAIAVCSTFAMIGLMPLGSMAKLSTRLSPTLAAQGYSNATPTISSGFGTAPSVTAGQVASFRINVGTGGAATGGVIAMNFTAPTGWNCLVNDLTAAAANVAAFTDRQTASTTTTVTVQHQTLSTGAALVYSASDIIQLICTPF